MRPTHLYFLSLFVFSFFVSSAQAAEADAYEVLSRMPVQHAGRVKPFMSFAEQAVLEITEQDHFEDYAPTELVWQWIAKPEEWQARAFIPVAFRPLRDELGLRVVKGRISPEILLSHDEFIQGVQAIVTKQERQEKLTHEEQERLSLYNKASFFRRIGQGEVPGWVANTEDPRKGWLAFKDFSTLEGQQQLSEQYPEAQVSQLYSAIPTLLKEIRSGPELAGEIATAFSFAFYDLAQGGDVTLDRKNLDREYHYLKLGPFGWAWKLYMMCILFTLLSFFASATSKRRKGLNGLAIAAFFLGFAVHAYGFYLRVMIAGRPPVSNMYEWIIWVSWAVVLFSGIFFLIYRHMGMPAIAGAVAVFALLIAESFPVVLNPAIQPLVPVLRSNLWLTIHVLTITLSYGAFALAWGMGHGVVLSYAFWPKRKELQQNLSRFLYRSLQVGVILLAAGTVLGGVWANYSWGRFWGWDPKETWALIALLGYLAVLHGRFAGWWSSFGTAVGAIVAFLGIIIAWYGVNFVLAAGLHSYGFGGGGLGYAAAVVLVDAGVLALAIWRHKKNSQLIEV